MDVEELKGRLLAQKNNQRNAIEAAEALQSLAAERDAARKALIDLTAESYAGEGHEAFLAAWELVGTFNDAKESGHD